MQIELRNHPAQAQVTHPVTGDRIPAFDKDKKPVPLFPGMHGIYVAFQEGDKPILFGYCGKQPGAPISLIYHLPKGVSDEIRKYVEERVGPAKGLTMPPPLPEPDDTDTDLEDE